MRIGGASWAHLCYCLNVHPAETWDEALGAIKTHALAVRETVCPDRPFGLGLRLSNRAAEELSRPGEIERFADFLAGRGLYVFTVNGFPYGNFHQKPVKESVYAPDWRTPERLSYTLALAEILARLLPRGETGSVSTVPGSWKPWIKSPADLELIGKNLARAAEGLAGIEERTGGRVNLALEPEPGCLLETTAETLEFFEGLAEETKARVGVCLDTAHAATAFEDPCESLLSLVEGGVPVFKLQISAALSAFLPEGIEALQGFVDPVYLHQARVLSHGGPILAYDDLPQALENYAGGPAEMAVHFHLPLHAPMPRGLKSTAEALSADFFAAALQNGVSHYEIETYTFDVLPQGLKTGGVDASIIKEYEWVLSRLPRP